MDKQTALKALQTIVTEHWDDPVYNDDSKGLFGVDVNVREHFKHHYIVPLMSQAWQDNWIIAHENDDEPTIENMHEELERETINLEMIFAAQFRG